MRHSFLAALAAGSIALCVTPALADPALDKALCDAAEKGSPATITNAVNQGGQIGAICEGSNYTPLTIAVEFGSAENVDALLALGAPVNQPDGFQDNPLTYVHSPAVTRSLLAHGADPGQRNHWGETALLAAASRAGNMSEQDAIDIAQMLLDQGANINAVGSGDIRSTVLINAINSKQNRYIEYLIDHGAAVNARNSSNNTPLDVIINAINLAPVLQDDPAPYREAEALLRAHGAVQ